MKGKRHIKRFAGGRMSPQQFHAQHAFPPSAQCQGCGRRPTIRAIVMAPLDEAEKRGLIPMGASKAPFLFPALAPFLVPIQDGGTRTAFIRTSLTYSCPMCRKDFEKALAKSPSWAIVEINAGPDPKNRVQLGAT